MPIYFYKHGISSVGEAYRNCPKVVIFVGEAYRSCHLVLFFNTMIPYDDDDDDVDV